MNRFRRKGTETGALYISDSQGELSLEKVLFGIRIVFTMALPLSDHIVNLLENYSFLQNSSKVKHMRAIKICALCAYHIISYYLLASYIVHSKISSWIALRQRCLYNVGLGGSSGRDWRNFQIKQHASELSVQWTKTINIHTHTHSHTHMQRGTDNAPYRAECTTQANTK